MTVIKQIDFNLYFELNTFEIIILNTLKWILFFY